VYAIYREFQKALDKVDYNLLYYKLKNQGGNSIKLLFSYLSDRTQAVNIMFHVFDKYPVLLGVPQDRFLGTLLF